MKIAASLCVLWVALLAGVAQAGTMSWTRENPGGFGGLFAPCDGSSMSGLSSCSLSLANANIGGAPFHIETTTGPTEYSTNNYRLTFNIKQDSGSYNFDVAYVFTASCSGDQIINLAEGSCNDPASCGRSAGQTDFMYIADDGLAPGTGACGNDHCGYTVESFRTYIIGGGNQYRVKTTGEACEYPDQEESDPAPPGTAACAESGGSSSCVSPTRPNCGQVNGDYVCTDSLRSGCAAYASGAVACVVEGGPAPATASPPLPDNGSPGTPADPTAVVEGAGVTINYYSGATVAGSSAAPTSGVQGSSSGNEPLPTVGGGGVGVTTGAGANGANGDCGAEGKNCSSTGSAQLPGLDEEDTVQSVGDRFVAGIQESEMFVAVNAIADSIPAGTCPSATFTMFGETYDFMESGCALWEEHIAPTLGTIMDIIWALLGVMIVLTA